MKIIQTAHDLNKIQLKNISVDFTIKSNHSDIAAIITVFDASLDNVSIFIYLTESPIITTTALDDAMLAIASDDFETVVDAFQNINERR